VSEDVCRECEVTGCKMHLWQPIETAPKDGTEFLAWRYDAGTFFVRWVFAGEFMTEQEIEESELGDDNLDQSDWWFADFIMGGPLNDEPAFTHWMPLPSPPDQ
jgi:hypothetical protein